MKALTIWQPWASLIIIGAKPREFRPRSFLRYIGPPKVGERIAIHSAMRPIRRDEVVQLKVDLGMRRMGTTASAARRRGRIRCAVRIPCHPQKLPAKRARFPARLPAHAAQGIYLKHLRQLA